MHGPSQEVRDMSNALASCPPKLRKAKGVITYIEQREHGCIIRLNTKIWAYLDNKKYQNIKPIISYGNTITVEGTPYFNGRREIIKVDNIKQNTVFELKKIIPKIKKTDSDKPEFLAYLYTFRKSLYEKFIKWSTSRKSLYYTNPYKLYLNNYLDYHTAKSLADVLSVRDVNMALPALIKYLLEEAQLRKKTYDLQTLTETIKLKYPEVTTQNIIDASPYADVVIQDNKVFLKSMFYIKEKCLEILKDNTSSVDANFLQVVEENTPELTSLFKEYRYFCITGQAGSGKSTFALRMKSFPKTLLSATTGKAAERLGVATIHKLLGFGKDGFRVKKLDCNVLVLDESSMLDWRTLLAVLKACRHVVFVGDPEQLPPVQGENVFSQLVKLLPTYNLSKQWRQTKHNIVNIESLPTLKTVFQLYKKYLPSVQILTPLVVGPWGTEAINRYIHKELHGTSELVCGSRVILNENIYMNDTLLAGNGTTGEIIAKNNQFYLVKSKNGNFWAKKQELSLAYALTIHKAQGSEWDYVIVIIPDKLKEEMVTDELKHVALTRAKIKTYYFHKN